jgi:hypothetical protein
VCKDTASLKSQGSNGPEIPGGIRKITISQRTCCCKGVLGGLKRAAGRKMPEPWSAAAAWVMADSEHTQGSVS